PLAMSAYDLVLARPFSARTARMAAVSVVLPWSMCPIVPTLTCGLVLANVSLAMVQRLSASLVLYCSTPFGITEVDRRELPSRPTLLNCSTPFGITEVHHGPFRTVRGRNRWAPHAARPNGGLTTRKPESCRW